MPFNIRPLNENDYDGLLVGWWKDWGWEPPQKDFLPDDGKGGIMILDEDEPVCAGFIYTTNSNVSWLNWIISNKGYRKKPQRKEAIKLLLSNLIKECKKNGSKYIFSNNNNNSLIEYFINDGFIKGCTNSTELIKMI
jgi:hypothetical protein